MYVLKIKKEKSVIKSSLKGESYILLKSKFCNNINGLDAV